jgi:hypothetical protein
LRIACCASTVAARVSIAQMEIEAMPNIAKHIWAKGRVESDRTLFMSMKHLMRLQSSGLYASSMLSINK